MTPNEWFQQYRMIGNTLIDEGKWAKEVMAEKARAGTLVKDRLKEGKATLLDDEMTGVTVVSIEKLPGYLSQKAFYKQVEELIDLYDTAVTREVDIPPWMECKRIKPTKENVPKLLSECGEYLEKVNEEYKTAWKKAIPKEMSFFHSRIEENVHEILEYMEEKYKEIAEYDKSKATGTPRTIKPNVAEF